MALFVFVFWSQMNLCTQSGITEIGTINLVRLVCSNTQYLACGRASAYGQWVFRLNSHGVPIELFLVLASAPQQRL